MTRLTLSVDGLSCINHMVTVTKSKGKYSGSGAKRSKGGIGSS